MERLLSAPDAAKVFGVSAPTFRKYIADGHVEIIPVLNGDGIIRYDATEVERLASIFVKPKRGRPRAAIPRLAAAYNGPGEPAEQLEAGIPASSTAPAPLETGALVDVSLDVLAQTIKTNIQKLTITEGAAAGSPMEIYPWEELVIHDMLTNRFLALSIARANGKSAFCAALGCEAFVGALSRSRGEVDIFAAGMKQSRIVFKHVLWFLKDRLKKEKWDGDKRFRVVNNTQELLIEDYKTGSILQARGSDAARAHGMAPHFVIADEPAQWVGEGGNAELFETLSSGMGKQLNSKMFAIGTMSDDPENWFRDMIEDPDEYTAVHNYSCADDDDDFTMESILKANPSYNFKPDLREDLRMRMVKAKKGGRGLRSWRALNLNKGTPINFDREAIVTPENWKACVYPKPPARTGPLFVGFDLGGGTSMTACAFYWPETGRLESYGAFPAQPDLDERGENDYVGDRYLKMFERKELFVYPGLATNNILFLMDMMKVVDGEEVMVAIGDRFKMLDVGQAMSQADSPWPIEFRGVGRGPDGSADIRGFQHEVLSGHLKSGQSLLMESAIKESTISRDQNGNAGLDKRRAKGRNDALQAAVLAVGAGFRWRVPQDDSEFDTSDYIV